MLIDYRNTKYCKEFKEISQKKHEVENLIKKDHSKAKDMHVYVSKNNKPYKKEFMKVYNYKCSYCGASINILPKEMFEIDHYIHRESKLFKSKKEAGYMENLVLACHSCNHKKASFEITEDNFKYLYPDNNDIKNTFVRDDMFYIKISEDHKTNPSVKSFYSQLNLYGEVHRIDYLVMNMLGLQENIKDKSEICAVLGEAINKLKHKRNIM